MANCNNKLFFFVILVIVILIILYLIWRNSQKNNLKKENFEKFSAIDTKPTLVTGINHTYYNNPNLSASITNVTQTTSDNASDVFLSKFNKFKSDINKIACYLLTVDHSINPLLSSSINPLLSSSI